VEDIYHPPEKIVSFSDMVGIRDVEIPDIRKGRGKRSE